MFGLSFRVLSASPVTLRSGLRLVLIQKPRVKKYKFPYCFIFWIGPPKAECPQPIKAVKCCNESLCNMLSKSENVLMPIGVWRMWKWVRKHELLWGVGGRKGPSQVGRTMQGGCRGTNNGVGGQGSQGDGAGGEEVWGAGTMCRGDIVAGSWSPAWVCARLGIRFANNDINSAGRAAAPAEDWTRVGGYSCVFS